MAPKFKSGDLVKIIVGRQTSNKVTVKNIVRAEVVNPITNPGYWGKSKTQIKLLQGKANTKGDYYTSPKQHRLGSKLEIFTDALELIPYPTDHYDLI